MAGEDEVKILKDIGFGVWLGIALGVIDITPWDWRFYLVLVPTALLVFWRESD
jgi:hypothetical protein